MIESTPVAPVGLGSAEGTPPQEAQEPMAMIAAALEPTSFRTSNRRTAAELHVNSLLFGRDRAFDDEHEFSGVFERPPN